MYLTKDAKRLAQLPLYSEANSICIADEFVSLAMKDRKVLSYLIADPFIPEHNKRIKLFPSRNVKNQKKRLEIMQSLINRTDPYISGYEDYLPNSYEIFESDTEKEVDEEITEKFKNNLSDSDELNEEYEIEKNNAKFLKRLRKSNVFRRHMNFKKLNKNAFRY